MTKNKQSLLTLLFAFGLGSTSIKQVNAQEIKVLDAASDTGCWISTNNQITFNADCDREALKPDYWSVEFYSPRFPVRTVDQNNNARYSGLLTAATAEKVMDRLRFWQKFTIQYARWSNEPMSDSDKSYFNFRGPIAVFTTSRFGRKGSKGAARAEASWEKITSKGKEILSIVRSARSNLKVFDPNALSTDRNPFKDVGKVAKDYIDNLKDAAERAKAVEVMVESGYEGASGPMFDALDRCMDKGDTLSGPAISAAQNHQDSVPTQSGFKIVGPAECTMTYNNPKGSIPAYDYGINFFVDDFNSSGTKYYYIGQHRTFSDEDKTTYFQIDLGTNISFHVEQMEKSKDNNAPFRIVIDHVTLDGYPQRVPLSIHFVKSEDAEALIAYIKRMFSEASSWPHGSAY